ncbi:MAG TPA: META domain-containing protein [Jiangellaceae bacterium]
MTISGRSAVVGLTAMLLLTSCAHGSGRDEAAGLAVVPTMAGLDGKTVVTDGIVDPDRDLVTGSRITMSFTADSVSVNAGCNTLLGPASIDDYELVVDLQASTQMACDQALEEQDQWLTSFLAARPRFERVDDDLYLSRDDTTIHLAPEVEVD